MLIFLKLFVKLNNNKFSFWVSSFVFFNLFFKFFISLVQTLVKKESPKEESQDTNRIEQEFKFIVEELQNLKKFYVSNINDEWVKARFDQWVKTKGVDNAQLQSESDAEEFLKPFWSSCNGTWWTKEYADEVYKLLPDNSGHWTKFTM